jgi:5-methylcytosine-specific restriction endonuclease McrA
MESNYRVRKGKQSPTYLGHNIANRNAVFKRMKVQAKIRDLEFNLTREFVYCETQKTCFYCSEPPSNRSVRSSRKEVYFYNGLDRIDSSLGYTETNVVPCCYSCNRAKSDLSQSEFYALVEAIYKTRIAA